MNRLSAVALVVMLGGLLGACADDDTPRPVTWRQVCQADGEVRCAVDARRDACAGRATGDAAACETSYVAQCCGLLQGADCDGKASYEAATYVEFETCRAAVDSMSCAAADDNAQPAECVGVVK